MGDEADRLIDLFWKGIDVRAGRGFARRPSWQGHPDPKCTYCGQSEGLRWKETENGWRLHEKEHPGNQYVQHVCPTTADGFEDEPL